MPRSVRKQSFGKENNVLKNVESQQEQPLSAKKEKARRKSDLSSVVKNIIQSTCASVDPDESTETSYISTDLRLLNTSTNSPKIGGGRRDTYNGGADELEAMLENSDTMSKDKHQRRETVDPADMSSILRDLEKDPNEAQLSEISSRNSSKRYPAPKSPKDKSSDSRISLRRSPRLSKTKATEEEYPLNRSTASSHSKELSGLLSDLSSETDAFSACENNRRTTVDAADMESLLDDLEKDHTTEEEERQVQKNPKLPTRSSPRRKKKETDISNISSVSGTESNCSVNTYALLGSVEDILNAEAEKSVVQLEAQEKNTSRRQSRESVPFSITSSSISRRSSSRSRQSNASATNSVGDASGEDKPTGKKDTNIRETVDPTEIDAMLLELEHQEESLVSETNPTTPGKTADTSMSMLSGEGTEEQGPTEGRRETINSVDMRQLQEDLDAGDTGSVGGSTVAAEGFLDESMETDQSIATVGTLDLLASVQETLNELDAQVVDKWNVSLGSIALADLLPSEAPATEAHQQEEVDKDNFTIPQIKRKSDSSIPHRGSSSKKRRFSSSSASKPHSKTQDKIQALKTKSPSKIPAVRKKATPSKAPADLSPPKPTNDPLLSEVVLKSCLSSRKKPRSSNSTGFIVESARKNVIFGSPQAAEFRRTSPTTRFTPLEKSHAKALFSMEPPLAAPLDAVTQENDRILEEWERLTNTSDYDSDEDILAAQSPFNSPKPAPKSKKASGNKRSLLADKRSKRRSSMGTPSSNNFPAEARENYSFPDDHLHSLDQSTASIEVTNTVSLPGTLAQLVAQNDVDHTSAVVVAPTSKISPPQEEQAAVDMSEDCTEEIEPDLYALMSRIESKHRFTAGGPSVAAGDNSLDDSRTSLGSGAPLADSIPNRLKELEDSIMSGRSSSGDSGGRLADHLFHGRYSDVDPADSSSSHLQGLTTEDSVVASEVSVEPVLLPIPDGSSCRSSRSSERSTKSVDNGLGFLIGIGPTETSSMPVESQVDDSIIEDNYMEGVQVAGVDDSTVDVTETLEPNLGAMMSNLGSTPIITHYEPSPNVSLIPEYSDRMDVSAPLEDHSSIYSVVDQYEEDRNHEAAAARYASLLPPVKTADITSSMPPTTPSAVLKKKNQQLMNRIRALQEDSRNKSLTQCSTPGQGRQSIGVKRSTTRPQQSENKRVRVSLLPKVPRPSLSAQEGDKVRPMDPPNTSTPGLLLNLPDSFPTKSPAVNVSRLSSASAADESRLSEGDGRTGFSFLMDPMGSFFVEEKSEDMDSSVLLANAQEMISSTPSSQNAGKKVLGSAVLDLFDVVQMIKNILQPFQGQPEIFAVTLKALERSMASAYVDAPLGLLQPTQQLDLLNLVWEASENDREIVVDIFVTKEPELPSLFNRTSECLFGESIGEQILIDLVTKLVIERSEKANSCAPEQPTTVTPSVSTIQPQSNRFIDKIMGQDSVILSQESTTNQVMCSKGNSQLSQEQPTQLPTATLHKKEETEDAILESQLMIDVINKLSFCKVTQFRPQHVAVTASLSSCVDVKLQFCFQKTMGGGEEKLELVDTMVDLEIAAQRPSLQNGVGHTVTPRTQMENSFVRAYFSDVMCGDGGPLNAEQLLKAAKPSDIPPLLHRITANISVLRVLLSKLRNLTGHGWTHTVEKSNSQTKRVVHLISPILNDNKSFTVQADLRAFVSVFTKRKIDRNSGLADICKFFSKEGGIEVSGNEKTLALNSLVSGVTP